MSTLPAFSIAVFSLRFAAALEWMRRQLDPSSAKSVTINRNSIRSVGSLLRVQDQLVVARSWG